MGLFTRKKQTYDPNAGRYTLEQVWPNGLDARPAFLPPIGTAPLDGPNLPCPPDEPFDPDSHERVPIKIKPEVRAILEPLLPEGSPYFGFYISAEGRFELEVMRGVPHLGTIPKEWRDAVQVERDDEADVSGGCCLEPDGSAWVWFPDVYA